MIVSHYFALHIMAQYWLKKRQLKVMCIKCTYHRNKQQQQQQRKNNKRTFCFTNVATECVHIEVFLLNSNHVFVEVKSMFALDSFAKNLKQMICDELEMCLPLLFHNYFNRFNVLSFIPKRHSNRYLWVFAPKTGKYFFCWLCFHRTEHYCERFSVGFSRLRLYVFRYYLSVYFAIHLSVFRERAYNLLRSVWVFRCWWCH